MASPQRCFAHLSRNVLNTSIRPAVGRSFVPASIPTQQIRCAANTKYKKKDEKKKKKGRSTYILHDLKHIEQFALLDAMRYIRAFEVEAQSPSSPKYELHVKLRTAKNGAVVRNRLRLPHPVKTDLRICVIAPRDSPQGKAALAAGAAVVGEEEVFEAIKDEGRIDFDRCVCHPDSLQKMNKAGLGRVLGPRGLMPSAKLGTVVKDTGAAVRDMVGGAEYRERLGVVRMAVGQLAHTPEQLQRNIKAFIDSMKKDMAQISDRTPKDIHEVVLSSTRSPGFSLNGNFRGPESPDPKDFLREE